MPTRARFLSWRARAALLLLGSLATLAVQAQSLPPALRDWEAWVLHDHEEHRCPWLIPGTAQDEHRICAWPGVLELQADTHGAHFSQHWEAYTEGWLALPGSPEQWPQEVMLDGRPAPLVEHAGAPAVRVSAGTHTLSGAFRWARRPELLPLPESTALVTLVLDGNHVGQPQRSAAGIVLGAQAQAREDNGLEVRVFRRLADDLPAVLATDVHLAVAGEAREVRLPGTLPPGFVPVAIEGELAARLDPDNTLRVQVRPGEWDVTVTARGPSPLKAVRLTERPAPWPAEEVWSFEARDELRVVSVEGVPATDPAQANVPQEWRQLPAYRMQAGAQLRLTERSRGASGQDANQLSLRRIAWLDLSGAGFTVEDHISGQMRRGWRLEMSAPYALQSARTGTDDSLLVTTGMREGDSGIEVRERTLDIRALSRLPRAGGALPASGWRERFDSVTGELILGPGYRLLAAGGPDSAPEAWLERWRLLDIFVVLLIATAAWRLLGIRVALLAVAAVVLTYQERGAPTWLWLNVLIALALLTAVSQGRLRSWIGAYRLFALALLALALVPFVVTQARLALYPQLEQSVEVGADANAQSPRAQPQTVLEEVPERELKQEALRGEIRDVPTQKSPVATLSASAVQLQEVAVAGARQVASPYEAGVLVQAGPGLPAWRYHAYRYAWNGPLEPDATARFLISPPWLTRLWRIAGIALSLLLIVQLAGAELGRLSGWLRPTARGAAVAMLLALAAAVSYAPAARAQQTPDPELLKQLQSRLLQGPKCVPACGAILAAEVTAAARLEVSLTVSALDTVGIALPGADPNWAPDQVQVDGASAGWVYRDPAGVRHVTLSAGRHVVRLAGPLEGIEGLTLAFPLAPHAIEVSAPGWEVSGVNERRLVSGALELVRRHAAQEGAGAARQTEFPPFVRVRRLFHLGHEWTIATQVTRVAPPAGAFTVRLPLLPQESVTTEALEAREAQVSVGLASGQDDTTFTSLIPIAPHLQLAAASDDTHSEYWVFEVERSWHAEISGVPNSAAGADEPSLYEYYPRPGEHLELSVTRPAAVAGGTLAYDGVSLETHIGKRSSEHSLTLRYRSTQGGRQILRLPPDAEVTVVRSDADVLGLRPENGELPLPALPGRHSWTVGWRDATGTRVLSRSPAVGLSAPAGNLSVRVQLPQDRWVLYSFGRGIGPTVLYWGELVVFLVAAWLIGRSRLTPLGTRDWLLLGLGLSTFSWGVLALFAVFIAVFQWRSRAAAPTTAERFNLMQVGLALLAVAAVLSVVAAVPRGLLALPDMRIAGGGEPTALHWFFDRSADALPQAGVLSVSLWWYKLAMLAWALWLSFALTRWIKWAWEVYSREGLWRSPAARTPPPPATSA